MKLEHKIYKNIDYLVLMVYLLLLIAGWVSVYSVGYQKIYSQASAVLFPRHLKQAIWILTTVVTFFIIMSIDSRVFHSLSYIIYALSILFLLGTFILGRAKYGHKSWYNFGGLGIQPAEFMKLTTTLALSNLLNQVNKKIYYITNMLKIILLISLPMSIILVQGDAGSSIVFLALGVTLYREGLPLNWISKIIFGIVVILLSLIFSKIYLIVITVIFSFVVLGVSKKKISNFVRIASYLFFVLLVIMGIDYGMNKVLKPHQKNRIQTFINPSIDPKGIGYNINQAKIAIGSGGFRGKGFLQGTQTNYGFVPAQVTDFIFCTIGEEFGWIGSSVLILLFTILLILILNIAERQNSKFNRVYGYSVFSIMAFHYVINIGMTIGIMPVIGIPLPFLSYGGSALLSFSIMLFILLRMDVERLTYLSNKSFASKSFF